MGIVLFAGTAPPTTERAFRRSALLVVNLMGPAGSLGLGAGAFGPGVSAWYSDLTLAGVKVQFPPDLFDGVAELRVGVHLILDRLHGVNHRRVVPSAEV